MKIDVLQVGAHDGRDRVYEDALLGHVKTGILLEPIPRFFRDLTKTYSCFLGDIICLNQAIHPTATSATLQYVAEQQDGLPDWITQIGSMREDVCHNHEAWVGRDIPFKAIEVECTSFEALIARFDVAQVRWLQVDTEGMDAQIVKSYPFHLHKPERIIFERKHLGRDELNELAGLLSELGYQIHPARDDMICVLL